MVCLIRILSPLPSHLPLYPNDMLSTGTLKISNKACPSVTHVIVQIHQMSGQDFIRENARENVGENGKKLREVEGAIRPECTSDSE